LILSGRKFNPFRTFSLEAFSDEVLLFAIAGGADWAMEPLYQRYSRLLYALAYPMITDHQVAQNLTQETFLAVWRHASAFASQAGAVRSLLLSFFAPPHHRLAACSLSSLQLAGGHVGAGRGR